MQLFIDLIKMFSFVITGAILIGVSLYKMIIYHAKSEDTEDFKPDLTEDFYTKN